MQTPQDKDRNRAARIRRRDRHGRGLRGVLIPPGVPLYRTRAERFDDLVLQAVARLEPQWEAHLSAVEFAVEEIPPPDAPTGGARGPVPLSRLDPGSPGEHDPGADDEGIRRDMAVRPDQPGTAAGQPRAEELQAGGLATGGLGNAGPGSAEPGSAGPDKAGPGSAAPGSAGSGNARPSSAGPGSAEPGKAGSDSAEPGSAGPGSAGPRNADPGGTEPDDGDAAAVDSGGPGPPRIVVYRRPLLARADNEEDLGELVFDVVVEEFARLLGIDPRDVDSGYSGGE